MEQNNMPVIQPVPIKTKGLPWSKALWVWLTSQRKWVFVNSWYMPFCDVRLYVPRGYVFNGASVPRLFWWLFSPSGLLFIPSVFHDMAYTRGYVLMERDGDIDKGIVDRNGADTLFMDVGIEVNGLPWIHKFIRAVLFVFAGLAWQRCEKSREHYRSK